MRVWVAVNSYGVIGKRVADAIRIKPDAGSVASPDVVPTGGNPRPATDHRVEAVVREGRHPSDLRRAGRRNEESGRSMMDTAVLPLDSPAITLATGGGKGVNLSELARAGFPVPPGFLITTAAYRSFVEGNDLHQQIMRLASDAARDKHFEQASAAIRALFEWGTMPPEVATAIRQAYAALSPDDAPASMAIRSSATAEDLPGASFAGQQETYLHVRDEQAVLEAVQRCWRRCSGVGPVCGPPARWRTAAARGSIQPR